MRTRTLTRIRPRRAPLLGLALMMALGSFLVSAVIGNAPPRVPAIVPAPAPVQVPDGGGTVPLEQPLVAVDRAIAVWTGNLDRDDGDYIAATNLAQLYLSRGRLTGAGDDYQRALAAADAAQSILPDSLAVQVLHGQVKLALHDFAGAASGARAVLAENPDLTLALAVLGDASLELGDYPAASEAYSRLASRVMSPAVTARLARLAAVTGSLQHARKLADEAAAATANDPAVAPADRAWFAILVGALAFQAGDLVAAHDAYKLALDSWPSGPAALAGFGRTQAALGDRAAAIDSYEAAVRLLPLPEWLAALGDLYGLSGRSADAQATFEQVRAIAALDAAGARLYSRGVIGFLANHGETPGLAVAAAAADLARRQDVYALDAYAWALYAAGRYDEAAAASRAARAEGTEDAVLDYHAGMIAAAQGLNAEARAFLRAALQRNPTFDPLQAPRARAVLLELGARR